MAHLDGGGDPAAFDEAMTTAEALIWSVAPKLPDEVGKLAAMLPKLIGAVMRGVHSCMGAHLARLELKIALQEWLQRVPEFSLKPDAKIEYRPGGVVGPELVPLVW